MSEDKELPASAKKLRKARDEGQDPQSLEIYDFCDLVIVAMTMTMMLPPILVLVLSLLRFDPLLWRARSNGGADAMAFDILLTTLRDLAPALVGSCFVAGILGYIGNRRRPPKIVPLKVNYNPIRKAGEMFKPHQLVSGLRGWLGAVIIMGIAAWICSIELPAIVAGGFCSDTCDIGIAQGIIWLMLLPALALKFLTAVIDTVMKGKKFVKDQKMSHDEAKRERKEEDGDPHVKGRRKRIAREIASGS